MKSTFSDPACSVARTVELFGDSWTPLIMRDAIMGTRRFDEFQKSLGIARNVLSNRLTRLVERGVMTKQLYQEHPPRREYILTDKGRDFFSVLIAMREWEARWLDEGSADSVTLHHSSCRHELIARTICGSCGADITLDDIEFHVEPACREG
ncbi:winged helix-turn-helix transcriptional regulator [Nocardia sp. NPDC052278]|uniref:winged helix-turn-helix transcriptional regulator n=1 Tax=unclassified Nocardia TaxID=2637762 RepID=UPI003693A658